MFTSLEKFDIHGNEFGSLRWVAGEEMMLSLAFWISEKMEEMKERLLDSSNLHRCV